MEPKIVSKAAFTVAGLVHRGVADSQKMSELWGRFFARYPELQGLVTGEAGYGVMANYDETTQEFDYIAGMEVAAGAGLPEGFVAVPIPAGEWAVFTTTIPEMGQTYPFIYGTWLPQSGYAHGPAPEYEWYGPAFDPSKPESPVDIYIPIVKA